MTKPTLSEQIVAAAKSDDESLIEQAIARIGEAAPDLRTKADAAIAAALDPAVPAKEARKMRDSAEDDRFEADRAEAAIDSLKQRLAVVREAKAEAARQERHDAATAQMAEIERQMTETWDSALCALGLIGEAMEKADRLIRIANANSPKGARSLPFPTAWSEALFGLSALRTLDGRAVVSSAVGGLVTVPTDEKAATAAALHKIAAE